MKNAFRLAASISVLLAVLATAGVGAQEQRLEILTIRNRPAEDLVPVVRPLVGAEGSVTASGDKLIVSASTRALADVARVVRELDVAPRSLWISVAQEQTAGGSARAAEVAGGVSSGGVTAQQPQTTETRTGTRVEHRTTRTVVSGAFAGASGSEAGSVTQSIQALEGRPAFISAGQSRPVATATSTLLQEASAGFYVIPRLSGDFVTLELAVSGDRLGPGAAVQLQRIETTASGRLGEWIWLGQLANEESSRSSSVLQRSTFLRDELSRVRIKVEAAR